MSSSRGFAVAIDANGMVRLRPSAPLTDTPPTGARAALPERVLHDASIMRPRIKKLLVGIGVGLVGGFGVIQLVPYGRQHANPPVVVEPRWDRPSTRALAVRACFDCHSNESVWPWYSHVAPVSWLVQSDVDQGRRALNFSDWSRSYKKAQDAGETVLEGKMPLGIYTLMHPEARLSAAEKLALAEGLNATLGGGTHD
jgi:hypothetical protein